MFWNGFNTNLDSSAIFIFWDAVDFVRIIPSDLGILTANKYDKGFSSPLHPQATDAFGLNPPSQLNSEFV